MFAFKTSASKPSNRSHNSKKEITEEIYFERNLITLKRKPIRNIYLRINFGSVDRKKVITLSAPFTMSYQDINAFLTSKHTWINRNLEKMVKHPPHHSTNSIAYQDGDIIYYLGKPYLLKVHSVPPKMKVSRGLEVVLEEFSNPTIIVTLKNQKVQKNLKPRPSESRNHSVEVILYRWYRNKLEEIITPLIPKWENKMGVKANNYRFKRMSTRWGTCNPRDKRIWLSVELIKKPFPAIEYVLVHELVHLMEPSHNHRFKALMSKFLPEWKTLKRELN